MITKLLGFLVLVLGFAIIICGICGGVIYYCWVLGIVDVIQQVKAQTVDEWAIAYDVVRIIFFGPIIGAFSWAIGVFTCSGGVALMTYKPRRYGYR